MRTRRIQTAEVAIALRGMKGKSAPGIDGVPTIFFKKFSNFFTGILADLFDWCYSRGEFPKRWSEATIQPIYKGKGSRSDPNNYRGNSTFAVYRKNLHEGSQRWDE